MYEEYEKNFQKWIDKDQKRAKWLTPWATWWSRRKHTWSDAHRPPGAPKTNKAEAGNSGYRLSINTKNMDLYKGLCDYRISESTRIFFAYVNLRFILITQSLQRWLL